MRREFLSSIWPINETKVSGKRLQKIFGELVEKDKGKKDEDRPNEIRRRRPDLEDGEITSDRDDRRFRDPYRDDRRQDRRQEPRDDRRDNRRDDRRDDQREESRRAYYDNGDRLNFHRHRRDGDRAGPVRHSWQSSRSPY